MKYNKVCSFKKEFNKFLEKSKEIFKLENEEDLEIINFIDFDDSIAYLVSVGDFCTLDVYIDKEDGINIQVNRIETQNYPEVNNINNIVKNIFKLIEECNKLKV